MHRLRRFVPGLLLSLMLPGAAFAQLTIEGRIREYWEQNGGLPVFGYPISDTLKKKMWVLDFSLGDFARVGMAGIFWLNRQDYNYFGHEIYLLPGQMIPEHKHVKTADAGPTD